MFEYLTFTMKGNLKCFLVVRVRYSFYFLIVLNIFGETKKASYVVHCNHRGSEPRRALVR